MATPNYVPVPATLQVRRPEAVPVGPPLPPVPRPAEVVGSQPHPPGFGAPCPDGGFALRLAAMRERQLALGDGERRADACAAVAAIGLRRAALLGRAPILEDIDIGCSVLGYRGPVPSGLRLWRRRWVASAARDIEVGQRLADAAQAALDLTAGPGQEQIERWWRVLAQERVRER